LATAELKRLVAWELAAGHSISELAERHSYTPRGMSKLCRSPEVQKLVEEEQARVMAAGERTLFKFMLHADALAQGMVDDALNASSPRQMEARKYILDRIVPTRSTQQAGVNLNLQITREVVRELGEAMKGLKDRPLRSLDIESTPHLIAGKEAFADEETITDAETS
jgi:hypothetical protein